MILNDNMAAGRRSLWLNPRTFGTVAAVIIAVVFAIAATGRSDAQTNAAPKTVIAKIGDHQITQEEMDARVLENVAASQPAELYDLRKQALDTLVNDYLLSQASAKAHLTTAEYLNRELKGTPVSDSDARKFYDEHKDQIQAQAAGRTFDQFKGTLIPVLERQQQRTRLQNLFARLRADNHVKIMLEAPRSKVASAGHPSLGGKDAPVTIVEFSDFQCPFCRAAENSIKQVREKYGDKVRLVYLDFPLSFHPHAMDAARAGRCAGAQDKFWQYHDAIFADQAKLGAADLKATAKKIGLNTKEFTACFDKKKYDAEIRKDQEQGTSLGVTGTPTFFINGRQLVGAQPLPKFAEIIDDELARGHQPAAEAQAKAN